MTDATESEESYRKVRRRRVKGKSSILSEGTLAIQELPEAAAAREAREALEAAERAMKDAILLIQCHERARIGRGIGAECGF